MRIFFFMPLKGKRFILNIFEDVNFFPIEKRASPFFLLLNGYKLSTLNERKKDILTMEAS